jgi:predicted ATPase
LSRALTLIASLPSTQALRREEINLQVALITPLMHFRGYGAPETKAAALRARTLVEQAEARGEAPDDPYLMFSVLYSFWVANFNGFHASTVTKLAAQFLARAGEKKEATLQMLGQRLVGVSQATIGNLAEVASQFDRAIVSYNPVEHRQLSARFGQDIRVAALCYRSWIRWMLGYPEAALADAKTAVAEAREVAQGVPLMYSLYFTSYAFIHCGEYQAADAQLDELIPMATEKNAAQWRGGGMMHRGCIEALTGKAKEAIAMIPAGIAAWKSSGSIVFVPWYVAHMATAHAAQGQFDAAWRHIDEALSAIDATGETWCESDIHRMAGEIALLAPAPDVEKARAHFDRALMVARAQQAKSWELRAATSLAALLRNQGRRNDARELLAPVYGWFGEGFDTVDLKEAKALLGELA